MTCGDSSYYPMNYYHGFYPTSMTRASDTQQPGGFPTTMLWTLICVSQWDGSAIGRHNGRIIYRKYPTLQQR